MDRRQWLQRLGLSAGAISLPFVSAGGVSGQETKPPNVTPRHLPTLKVTDDSLFDIRWSNLRRRDGAITKP